MYTGIRVIPEYGRNTTNKHAYTVEKHTPDYTFTRITHWNTARIRFVGPTPEYASAQPFANISQPHAVAV